MNSGILVEVCVDSVESAITAQESGAGRIELCSALEIGGLTPSKGLIDYVISRLKIPVHVLIRPRAGDFLYSDAELEVMLTDIYYAKKAGAAGIVTGMLNTDGSIDENGMKAIIKASQPLPITFHRAFDLTHDKPHALETIIKLKCTRLLTSGGFKSATLGSFIISELIKQAGGRISIMPGAGITENNFAELVEATGCSEFHLSASALKESQMSYENFHLKDVFPYTIKVADKEQIKAICSLASILSE